MAIKTNHIQHPLSPESALSNFLGSILDDSIRFQIQTDNARTPHSNSCETPRCNLRRIRRSRSNDNIELITHTAAPQRFLTKSTARWETYITSNDTIVSGPIVRSHSSKRYCEPEKLNGFKPIRSGNVPLAELTRPMSSSSIPSEAKKKEDLTGKPFASTSTLLDEALCLLGSDSSTSFGN